MAKESPARAILQWLMPSNADVMLISAVIWSRKDGLLCVNVGKDGEESGEESTINGTYTTILLIYSYKCLLLTQSPAICYRNNEEPDVHCTGSGEAHWKVKHYRWRLKSISCSQWKHQVTRIDR